jgi:hypothetical protein
MPGSDNKFDTAPKARILRPKKLRGEFIYLKKEPSKGVDGFLIYHQPFESSNWRSICLEELQNYYLFLPS